MSMSETPPSAADRPPTVAGIDHFVIGSVIAIAAILTGSIVLVSVLRPDKDNTALIGLIVASVAPTAAALLALVQGRATHIAVNSRVDKLLEQTDLASRAAGKADAETAFKETQ